MQRLTTLGSCLLAKRLLSTPTHNGCYAAEDMRPLSIVNTYNRILANALRDKLSTIADRHITLRPRAPPFSFILRLHFIDIP